jgi:hypothetical protein
MSTQFKAPVGLVPIERRWPKALVALCRRIRPRTGFRVRTGTGCRKRAPSREAKP